jgi:hypothetical protein
MTMLKWIVTMVCLGIFSVTVAAEPSPDGTVKLSSKAVAIGAGVTWGDGTLTFGGRTHTFEVNGLSVADLGISDITTSGEVFHLETLSDFNGTYVAGEAGAAIVAGPTDTIMKNEHGVVLRLHGTQKGARLTLAAQGVMLKLKN